MNGKSFIYMMRYPKDVTVEHTSKLHRRIISHRFWFMRYQREKHWYYGWVAFEKPLPLWDAMEAGLVPIFRRGGGSQ